jgi:hypothetical protein
MGVCAWGVGLEVRCEYFLSCLVWECRWGGVKWSVEGEDFKWVLIRVCSRRIDSGVCTAREMVVVR